MKKTKIVEAVLLLCAFAFGIFLYWMSFKHFLDGDSIGAIYLLIFGGIFLRPGTGGKND